MSQVFNLQSHSQTWAVRFPVWLPALNAQQQVYNVIINRSVQAIVNFFVDPGVHQGGASSGPNPQMSMSLEERMQMESFREFLGSGQ